MSWSRSILEIKVPGNKPGQKPTYVAWGEMPTAPANDAALDLVGELVVDCGPLLGDYKPRKVRPKQADGSRGAPLPQRWMPGARRYAPDKVDVQDEADVRWAVNNALLHRCYASSFSDLCPRVKVVADLGAIKTVPDKGMVVRWGSVDDLVRAILAGLV